MIRGLQKVLHIALPAGTWQRMGAKHSPIWSLMGVKGKKKAAQTVRPLKSVIGRNVRMETRKPWNHYLLDTPKFGTVHVIYSKAGYNPTSA